MKTKKLDKATSATLEALITKGIVTGTLPTSEIKTSFPKAKVDLICNILDQVESAGIRLVDSSDHGARIPAVTAPTAVVAKPLTTPTGRGRAANTPVMEKIDDPVRMYLTQMVKFRCLRAKKKLVMRRLLRLHVNYSGV